MGRDKRKKKDGSISDVVEQFEKILKIKSQKDYVLETELAKKQKRDRKKAKKYAEVQESEKNKNDEVQEFKQKWRVDVAVKNRSKRLDAELADEKREMNYLKAVYKLQEQDDEIAL